MLKELKFVMGAVSKKDFLPALTHFRIQGGYVRSFNGTLALCTPIALDIDCIPKAEPLVKAIQHCDDTVTVSMTPAGRLSIKSGKYRALIDCVDQETVHAVPEGNRFDFDGEALLKALKVIAPFIGDDASRPWTNGVLLKGQSAFATNNITLIEYWVGASFPMVCNIPRAAIREMLRIDEAPIYGQATENSITFHYSNERWIRTQLFDSNWPDLSKILDKPSSAQPIDERMFGALQKLKPFVDKMGRIFIHDGAITTHLNSEEGASYELDGLGVEGIYQIEMLALLKGVATSADFSLYPAPCLFFGNMLRGAIIGMKQE